jgi:hypothetical protein
MQELQEMCHGSCFSGLLGPLALACSRDPLKISREGLGGAERDLRLIGQMDDATTLQQHLERYGSPLLNLNERADTAVMIRRREVQLCMEDPSRDAAIPC